MLDTKKAAALLAPAFTDERLGKLLLLAVAHLEQQVSSKTFKRDADALWDVVERLRMTQKD